MSTAFKKEVSKASLLNLYNLLNAFIVKSQLGLNTTNKITKIVTLTPASKSNSTWFQLTYMNQNTLPLSIF